MTRLKIGKFMTDQVANVLDHVQWLNVILTPEHLPPFFSVGDSLNVAHQPAPWFVYKPVLGF